MGQSENGHWLSPNGVVLRMLFIFFSFKPVTVSAVMEDAERCSSNRRPLASVMGTLMVVDPQPAARYHPPNSI